MYVLIQEGKVRKYPYSISLLKQDNPGTSFPETISDALLESFSVYPVTPAEIPTHDRLTEYASKSISQVDGAWVENWTVERLDEETAAANVRGYRTKLLKQTDWTQLSDAPGDTGAWATYRQALRDISSQADFPYNIAWPEEPAS